MRDKFREFACDFVNESECEEEIDEEVLDLNELESIHYEDSDVDLQIHKHYENDEKKFLALVEMGMDEKTAAHVINRETEKHLKVKEL
jgi:hypothetical protein